jgi:hypothetical protein
MQAFGLLATMIAVVFAADSGDDAVKKDLQLFQGNWQFISLERDGKKIPPEEAKKLTLTIQGDRFVLRKG